MQNLIFSEKSKLIESLWEANPWIKKLLLSSSTLQNARERLFEYLNELERSYFNLLSELPYKNLHIVERNNAKASIQVLKNIIRTENEKLVGFSAINSLFLLAKDEPGTAEDTSPGFICEILFLFQAINGKTNDYSFGKDNLTNQLGGSNSEDKNNMPDIYAKTIREGISRYKTGTHPQLKLNHADMKKLILEKFGGSESDWKDPSWQLANVINDFETLKTLIKLEEDEIAGLTAAENWSVPFQITPYYLSLINKDGRNDLDRAVRAQVIPGFRYCQNVYNNNNTTVNMDFMDEKNSQPVEGITRRYPQIVILKVFDSCPQICVYCQRNWELKTLDRGKVAIETIDKAIDWIRLNSEITEVLITGGDPLTLTDSRIEYLLRHISAIKHIERIRIGTRVFVTLPFRITESLIKILKKYHILGKREICLVTHFEHVAEVTEDSIKAVAKVRNAGLSVYNQQVFTYYNSKRFETAALRKRLKLCGIDPYYSFNTKGKKETIDFRVPIARFLQERKEEARFLPGLVRTDEPVFNIPRFGKSHLRSRQDHEIIMILKTGERVYRFYPWQSKITQVDDYLYTDVSIYQYLKRMDEDGENINDYSSVWFYY